MSLAVPTKFRGNKTTFAAANRFFGLSVRSKCIWEGLSEVPNPAGGAYSAPQTVGKRHAAPPQEPSPLSAFGLEFRPFGP